MSLPLIIASLWVVAATLVAFMPMRVQMFAGPVLLVAALVLIVWIGAVHGFWVAALGLGAALSMFRKPLLYYLRKATTRRNEEKP